MSVRRLGLVVGTSILLLGAPILTACGGGGTDNALEQTIEDQTGQDVDVDSGNGTITASKDGTSVTVGEGATLPEGWPDLPTPDGGTVISSTSAEKDGKTIQIVTFKVDGNPVDAAKSLSDKLQSAGYTLDGSAVVGAAAQYGLSNDTYEIVLLTLAQSVTMTVEEKD